MIPQTDHSIAESSLLDQLKVCPYTNREEAFATSDDDWVDDHLNLVDKTCPKCMRGEFRTVDRNVVFSIGLKAPYRLRIELAHNSRPRTARLR